MDFSENPELKTTYDKCKYTVKVWEHNFKKKHGRLPSKLDIREADKIVRHAYRQYYQIKSAALEQSFKDIDGFNSDEEKKDTEEAVEIDKNQKTVSDSKDVSDDVWGSHLDNKKEEPQNKFDLNVSVSKKLFCGSKLSKRYARKSYSFSQKKSDVSFDSTIFSQTSESFTETISTEDDNLSFEGLFNKSSVKVVKACEKVSSQSTSIVQSVLDNNHKNLKSVDSGWLERVGQSAGVSLEIPLKKPQIINSDMFDETAMDLDFNCDDIIDNSDEEDNRHPAKRAKLEVSQKQTVSSVETKEKDMDTKIENQLYMDTKIENQLDMDTKIENQLVLEEKKDSPALPEPKSDPFEFDELIDTIKAVAPKNRSKKKVTPSRRKKKTNQNKPKKETPQSLRKSTRKTKTQISMVESNSEEEDPFHSDNDLDDPEFKLTKEKNKFADLNHENSDEPSTPTPIKTSKKSNLKSSKRKKREPEKKVSENEETTETYELEYSIKPRAAIPRFRNIKKLIKIETKSKSNEEESKENEPVVKSKRQQEKEKLEKKIQSGNLNENFVTINLRKKVYARGKKNMNFSKYKKQLWKSKKKALAGPDMDMGGCDGGVLTCFNCGDVGHFARNCTKNKGDRLMALEATVDEPCPFPTLEEASKMAQESAFAVRKSNLNLDENNTDAEKDASDDDEDIFNDDCTELLLAETLKIEQDTAKLNLHQYMDTVHYVEPYYRTQEDGSLIDTPKEVFDALQQFGHTSFRPGQEQAVMRILSGKSTLVTLSTGSGKSLCYQLPAYLYSKKEPCIALIISPLVSLMEDQVTGIPAFLSAACLHTNQTKTQREKVLESISSGVLNILLVSPEAVVAGEKQSGFGSLLRKLPPIAFACIDEAHCVSQWSHNFRPSYLLICRVLRERMGVRTVLGLTATATRSTSDSIIDHLQIPDGRDGIISDIPLPNNLVLTVSKDYQRDQALLALLTSERFTDCKSIIIYCTRREECNRIANFLRTSLQFEPAAPSISKKRKRINVQAEPYHAGLSASKRKSIQKAFMSGELRIVVATVAFGMGINKSNIRAVIHYNMPKNFESYVQEIGRAGRDGLPAHCHLFLDAKGNDENELRRHIYANSIDRHVIRKLLQKIFLPCSCKEICPKHEVAFSIEETVRALDIPEENISTLLCYLELHERKYVELLSPAYTVCKVISYGGNNIIRKAAKECPPLAMALALQKNKDEKEQNIIEFAVVDIAAAIGWDSGICKHKLKNLEWTTVNGLPKRSLLNVSFTNLGFRLLAPGNLNDEQLDQALDSLYDHVVNQEKTALLQLRAVHQTLVEVAVPSYKSCLSSESTERNDKLKVKIRDYFESVNPLDNIELTENKLVDEQVILNNIRGLISTYRDNNFTGRAVARIFHGVASPNYPAVIWGRCKYWRCHINVDFHTICKLATKEILNFR